MRYFSIFGALPLNINFMKKIILGLFLTVGISGMALAGSSSGVSETKSETIITKNEQGNADKKQVITYNYVNGVLFNCTIATHTRQYDTCGNYVGTVKESYEASGSACSGIEGGVKITVRRMMTGFGDCPANY